MRIQLSEERKEDILRRLTEMFHHDYDEDLSRFRAEQILQFFLARLGPAVYNQAIQDACGFMLEKVQDLDATYHEREEDGRPGVVAERSRPQKPPPPKGGSRGK
jgi:uncharacterized protein (DUF2164 family)